MVARKYLRDAEGLDGSLHPAHTTLNEVRRLSPGPPGITEQFPPLGGDTICTVRDADALTAYPVSGSMCDGSLTVRVNRRGPAPSRSPDNPRVSEFAVPTLFAGRDRSTPTT